MRLIVGLGNPGIRYENTRHNVGFMVVDRLAGEFGISVTKSKFEVRYGSGAIDGHEVMLARPMAYMNRSGWPLQKLIAYYRINSRDLMVIHDDIDLAFGRLKIKEKGGHGGHKGLKSIIHAVGQDEFVRLRVGVGRSRTGDNVSDHVLGSFVGDETKHLESILDRARDAVVTILNEGVSAGMNRFNTKHL